MLIIFFCDKTTENKNKYKKKKLKRKAKSENSKVFFRLNFNKNKNKEYSIHQKPNTIINMAMALLCALINQSF